MADYYLLKTEPTEYSFADLVKDKETEWDGVKNPVALKNLGEMKPGARLVIYETGDVKSAVGTATVLNVDAKDLKKPVVKIKADKGRGETSDVGRDQSEQAICEFAAGADWKIVCRAANRRAVQGAGGGVTK